jgi:hypothetical protein
VPDGTPATGEIIERRGADRRVHRSLRFRVNGKRYRQPLGAVSLDQARQELENPLADVRRGQWRPPQRAPRLPPSHRVAAQRQRALDLRPDGQAL